MSLYHCDWKECRRKPFAEIFYEDREEGSKWCYLCFWHFLIARLRRDKIGWCRVDTDREILEDIREEIWDLESDLFDLKLKLGIDDDDEEEEGEELDPMKKLWDNPYDEAWNIETQSVGKNIKKPLKKK